MLQKIRVWDLPTRVFHWMLAISFAGAYLTAESERYRDVHEALGYVMFGLLLFRLVWGVAGTAYARFGSFLYSPARIMDYVRSLFGPKPQHFVGHNPAGGVAILLLLGLGLLISISGLGLAWEWGNEDLFEELHEMAANLMLLVVIVHIVGVLGSSVLHKENLVRSMFTGYKSADSDAGIAHVYTGLGIVLALVSIAFLWFFLGYA